MNRIITTVSALVLGLSLTGAAFAERPKSIYLMELTIGDKVFNDIVMIDSTSLVQQDKRGTITESIKGSVSVPGNFSSPIYDGVIKYYEFGNGAFSIRFSINAVERGDAFSVTYISDTGDAENQTFAGKAMIAQNNEIKELGKFKAVLLVPVK